MELSNIISKIQTGKIIHAKVKPEYNHGNGRRTFKRKLRLVKSREGMRICVTTPVFKNYFLKKSEIVTLV